MWISKSFIIILCFLFITSIAVAIDIDSSRVFDIGDITYGFSQNMTFDSMQINNTNLMLNGVWFIIEADGHINLTINKFVDVTDFNFTYNVTILGTVFFNLSDYNFQREYMGGEDLVVLEKEEIKSNAEDVLDELSPFTNIFPFMLVIMGVFIVMYFVMSMFSRGGF